MNTKKQSPRRAKLPQYSRSAYRIFYDEKRAELITLQIKAYDESFERPQDQMNAHSIISLPQLNMEINKMWKGMSSRDRDKLKGRAMLDMKRQRITKKDVMISTTDDQECKSRPNSKGTSASVQVLFPTDGLTNNFEDITTDRFDDDSSSLPSMDLSIMLNPMLPWLDPLKATPGDQKMQKSHDPMLTDTSEVTTTSEYKMMGMLAVTRPVPNEMGQVPYTIQTNPTPASPPFSTHHSPICGEYGVVMGNGLISSFHINSLPAPLASSPTYTPSSGCIDFGGSPPAHSPPMGYCVSSNIIYGQPMYPPPPYYYDAQGYQQQVMSHPGSYYSQPFFPVYYSTGIPSSVPHSSSRLSEPLNGTTNLEEE